MPDLPDSLDIVEAVMAVEESVDRVQANPSLSAEQRDAIIRSLWDRIEDEFPDDTGLDDDTLAALVRKLGPRPRGSSGVAAQVPEPPIFE
jgi:hypothetical protein